MDMATHCLCPPTNLLLASISRWAAGLLVEKRSCKFTLDDDRVPLLKRELLTCYQLMSNSCNFRALRPVMSKFRWFEGEIECHQNEQNDI